MRGETWALLPVLGLLASLGAGCTSTDETPSSPGAGGSGGTGTGGSSGGSPAGATGGASTGSGGNGGAGGASNAGGTGGGTGGAGAGGTDASGGTAGAAGTAGTGSLSPSDFAGGLDGYLYTGECNGGSASFECPMSGCSGNVFNEQVEFNVGGDPLVLYDVTLHVYGVVELRSDYEGGTRRQGSSSNAASNQDFWYEGGSYTPGDGYNVYALRVTPAVNGVPGADDGGNNYFLNARDATAEGHQVWELNYEATLPVTGGGSIEITAYDPNCLQIMNNGETAQPSGTGPGGAIVVPDVGNAVPPPPADFEQPLSTAGRNGQWFYVDVVAVAPR